MSEVLLVGVRAVDVRTFEAVLAPLGHTLALARSGHEALGLFAAHDFAMVIVEPAGADSLGRFAVGKPGGPRSPECAAHAALEAEAREREIPVVFLAGGGDAETDRLALERSEALLRGAFEAAPIGKTVLDSALRIVSANRAFGLLLDREPTDLIKTEITSLARPDDRDKLQGALARVAANNLGTDDPDRSGFDVHLQSSSGSYAWTCAYLSSIDPTALGEPLLMIQWVDLSARRRAEQAHAELEVEHLARAQAEATAERLRKLKVFTDALATLSLEELLPELALRLAEQFDAPLSEVQIERPDHEGPIVVRAAAGRVLIANHEATNLPDEAWHQMPLTIEGTGVGRLRLVTPAEGFFDEADRTLLADLADRAALSIRRAQLHEQEHRIAVTLQRALLPTRPPDIPGLELIAHYESAGDVGEVGGDWYDTFELPRARLGIVLGDVAGKGISAASTMGQLRSVTRAFALGDEQNRRPRDVLTRLNRHQLTLGSEEMFTILYAIIDPHQREVLWANAGHPPPLLQTGDGDTRYLEGGDGLMGIDDVIYTDRRASIGSRDTLIFYTDGLVERRGESLDDGLHRLARAVSTGPSDAQALCRHIVIEIVPAERTPKDDVTIVLARIT